MMWLAQPTNLICSEVCGTVFMLLTNVIPEVYRELAGVYACISLDSWCACTVYHKLAGVHALCIVTWLVSMDYVS